jgi:hypothetical protein
LEGRRTRRRLGLSLLLALGFVYGVGYTTSAWLLGRAVARGARPMLAFVAGWAILRVIAIVPLLGGLTFFAAVVVGLGAIAIAIHRTRMPTVVAASAPDIAPTAP